jgi:hypothetical protein
MDEIKIKNAITNYLHGDSYSSIEHQGIEGMNVVSYFIRLTTTFFMTYICLVLSLLLVRDILKWSNLSFFVTFALITILFVSIPQIIRRYIKNNHKNDETLIEYFVNGIQHKVCEKKFSKYWVYLSIRFFSSKTLWLWILIVGLFRALIEINFSIIDREPNKIDTDKAIIFGISFIQSLIFVILTYIASNILSEILSVRADYGKHKDALEKLDKNMPIIEKSMDVIREAESTVVTLHGQLKHISNTERLEEKIESCDAYKTKKNKFKELLLGKYGVTIGNYYSLIYDKLTEHQYIDSWLVSSFMTISDKKIENILSTDTIATDFSIFASMIHAGLKNSEDFIAHSNIEIYTTFVLSPFDFIDYSRTLDANLTTDFKKQKMSEWKDYLEANKNYGNRSNIKIKRCFFIHELSDYDTSPEMKKIKKDSSYFNNIDNIKYKTYDSTLEFNAEHEPLRDDTGGTSVKDLVSIYCNNNAHTMILKDAINNDSELKKFILYLSDNTSNEKVKPADLYCIGIRKYNQLEWKLCLRTVYDSDMNMAKITILHEKSNNNEWTWGNVKEQLTKIFLESGHGVEIMKFDDSINYINNGTNNT